MSEDKHKRITKAQFDIWVNDPATRTYFQCLAWSAEQIAEVLGKGGFVDSKNNDHTSNQIHSALGQKEGLFFARNANRILRVHGMLDIDKPVEEKEKEPPHD